MSGNGHSHMLLMEVSSEVNILKAICKFANLPLLAFVLLKIEVWLADLQYYISFRCTT